MTATERFHRYQDLQRYIGWSEDDAARVQSAAVHVLPHLAPLIEDFYAEIDRHPGTVRVITGGAEQIARLKGMLHEWLRELLTGPYDARYVERRWRVGWRHVEIGLDQVYTNVALSRLRRGVLRLLDQHWTGDPQAARAIRESLNSLFDLDLALIEDAYQAEYLARWQRAERLAAIGQLGAGVAHELRNPLNVIKTSVYYLLNARNATPGKQAEHLQRIERQVILADGVITALSNFARMPVPALLPMSARRCLEEAIELNPMPATVAVNWNWPETLPDILADADQLRIAFANLLRNARDAMANGGTLTISGREVGQCVEVSIADTGVGIAAEDLSRVMEPLYTTKARGLGLGLALTRGIIEKCRGTITVRSTPGQGTVFTVQLQTHGSSSLR